MKSRNHSRRRTTTLSKTTTKQPPILSTHTYMPPAPNYASMRGLNCKSYKAIGKVMCLEGTIANPATPFLHLAKIPSNHKAMPASGSFTVELRVLSLKFEIQGTAKCRCLTSAPREGHTQRNPSTRERERERQP